MWKNFALDINYTQQSHSVYLTTSLESLLFRKNECMTSREAALISERARLIAPFHHSFTSMPFTYRDSGENVHRSAVKLKTINTLYGEIN